MDREIAQERIDRDALAHAMLLGDADQAHRGRVRRGVTATLQQPRPLEKMAGFDEPALEAPEAVASLQ